LSKELKKTFGHAGIYAVGVILNRAVSFLMLPVYTRYLLPADYGVMEILELTVDIVSIVTGMGILQGLFKFYYEVENEKDRKGVVSTIFIMIISFYAISCTFGVMMSDQLGAIVFRTHDYAYFIQISFINLLKFRRSDSHMPNYCIFNNIDKMEQSIRFNFMTKYIT